MPTERFDKDIELAKLQAKISDRFSMYYTMLAILFATYATLYLYIVSMPATKFTQLAQGATVLVAALFFIILTWDMKNWRNKFRADFQSIYDGKRIKY
jgi:Na+/proline symporter